MAEGISAQNATPFEFGSPARYSCDSDCTAEHASIGTRRAKWPLIAVLIAIAYLQYFYVDVMVQIASLPAIIFFILINGQMPPV